MSRFKKEDHPIHINKRNETYSAGTSSRMTKVSKRISHGLETLKYPEKLYSITFNKTL